jgi:hypothetical protein
LIKLGSRKSRILSLTPGRGRRSIDDRDEIEDVCP